MRGSHQPPRLNERPSACVRRHSGRRSGAAALPSPYGLSHPSRKLMDIGVYLTSPIAGLLPENPQVGEKLPGQPEQAPKLRLALGDENLPDLLKGRADYDRQGQIEEALDVAVF